MACYDDIISVKGLCSTPTVTPLYYLNDYGISLGKAAKLADDRYANGKAMIEAKINQAWEDTFSRITVDGFKYNQILVSAIVGGVPTDDSIVTLPATVGQDYVGYKFVLNSGCSLGRTYISQVRVRAMAAGTLTMISRCNGTDTTLYSGTVAAGWTVVNVNTSYDYDVSILVDRDTLAIAEGNGVTDFSGKDYSYLSYETVGTELAGMEINVQVRCDVSKHFCQFTSILAKAVVYRACALIYKEVLDTTRFNDIVILMGSNSDIATSTAKLAWFDSETNFFSLEDAKTVGLGMFQKELSLIKLPVAKCNCCAYCTGSFYKSTLP